MNIPELLKDVAPSAISAIGSIAGGTLFANMQHRLNRKDWQKVAEYNSLRSQVERAKDAHVNPNRVFADGSIENTAGDINQTDVSGAFNSASQGVQAAYGAKMASQSVKQMVQQTKLLEEQVESMRLENMKKRVQTDIDLDQLLGEQSLWTNIDENGVLQYGTYDETGEGGFHPQFDSEGNYIGTEQGRHIRTNTEIGQLRALANRISISNSQYESRRAKLEYQLREEFGEKEAASIIHKMDAEAFSANQSGQSMKLDNDFIGSLGFGSKTADMLTRFLGVAVRVFGNKK